MGLRLSKIGVYEGVYIFFNFHPQDDDDGERYKWSGDDWGYLPNNDDQQVAVARIADSIDELQHGKAFRLDEVSGGVPEFVRVVRGEDSELRKL